MASRPAKFVIKQGKGPNAKARIVFTGGNGETVMFGEGLKGGTSAAKKAIAVIKKEIAKATVKVAIPVAPAKKKGK